VTFGVIGHIQMCSSLLTARLL